MDRTANHEKTHAVDCGPRTVGSPSQPTLSRARATTRLRLPRLMPFALRLLLVLVVLAPFSLRAQDGVREGALRVFLDCNAHGCDSEYFRTEITFVNWARDRTLAQVHLIVTGVGTGGGGQLFTFDFIGLGTLDSTDDQLTYTSNSTDTEAETLEGLTRVMAAGLARYAALVGGAGSLRITAAEQDAGFVDRLVSASEVDDPWHFWVFEIGGSVDLEGEETETQQSYRGSAEARRTTDTWKLEFEARGNLTRNEIERTDGTVRLDERTSWNADVFAVHALAARWSIGGLAGASASTRQNQDLGAEIFAALEYSFLPYPEAPRRSFTARYDVGVRYFDWEDETIFRVTRETRPQHVLALEYFQRQPWGESQFELRGSQYLHDLSLTNVAIEGGLEFRILRGLSLEVDGEIQWIEDQLFISAEGLSDEDIFLGRFDRPTDFRYELTIGLSFEFGSIFNNVVNNRF